MPGKDDYATGSDGRVTFSRTGERRSIRTGPPDVEAATPILDTSLRRRREADHPARRVGYPATVAGTLPESLSSSPNPSRLRLVVREVGAPDGCPWSKARGGGRIRAVAR